MANCEVDEAQRAIAAASGALPAWQVRPATEGVNLLRRWFDLIVANTEDLARLMTAEQGKPLAEARAKLAYGASFVEWFAEEAERVAGETLAPPGPTGTGGCCGSRSASVPPSRRGTSPLR